MPQLRHAAPIRASITAKIGFFTLVSETLLLAVLGFFLLRSYNREIDNRLAEKLAIPGALMTQMALNFEAAADVRALERIVQAPVIEAFVARRDGKIFYASDPLKEGKDYTAFVPPPGASGRALSHTTEEGKRRLSLLMPLAVGGDTLGHLYLKVDAERVAQTKSTVLRLFLIGSALAVFLTVLIEGFWVHRLFVPRIERTVAALSEVKGGNLDARVGRYGAPDQIGGLMREVDAMIERVQSHTAKLRELAWAEAAHRAKSELLAALEEKNRQLEETFEELRRAQSRVVRSEKMAAMGTMAAGVAHDLNNILSGIVGYPDLLLAELPADSPLREGLGLIKESGVRAAAVVADLLTISRSAAYPTVACELDQLVAAYLQSPEHRELMARFPGVRVIARQSPAPRRTKCSPVHLQKVLLNLVMNACEAIQTEGTVTVSTGTLALAAEEAAARSLAPGEYVLLHVEDDGPGIAESDLAHIFEPFYTKKTLGRSGTGLGLTIVWNTAQEHGGAVTARRGEKGAVFTLLLPATAELVPAGKPAAPADALLRGSGTILVVDDERRLREIAVRMLTSLGYTVTALASGEEAIAYLRERRVDLVVLDMLMPPGINGCEAYREIARIRPGQRALICSGFSESEDYREAQRHGAGGFLGKPYGLEELGRAVKLELEKPAAAFPA